MFSIELLPNELPAARKVLLRAPDWRPQNAVELAKELPGGLQLGVVEQVTTLSELKKGEPQTLVHPLLSTFDVGLDQQTIDVVFTVDIQPRERSHQLAVSLEPKLSKFGLPRELQPPGLKELSRQEGPPGSYEPRDQCFQDVRPSEFAHVAPWSLSRLPHHMRAAYFDVPRRFSMRGALSDWHHDRMAKNLGFNLPKKLSPEVAKLMREIIEGESPDVPKRLEALSSADRLVMLRTLTGEVSKLMHKFDAMHRDERASAISVIAAVVAGLLGDSDAEAVHKLLMQRTQKQKRHVHCQDLTKSLADFLRADERWKSRETFDRRYPEFTRK